MKTKPQRHIALSGGIASGKSCVSQWFEERSGFCVIDADVIAHEVSAAGGEAIPAIEKAFGEEAIDANGAMNRDFMRKRAFADAKVKQALEEIIHPLVQSKMALARRQSNSAFTINVIPLLVETGSAARGFDRILIVDTDPQVQLQRLVHIRGLDTQLAQSIIAQQASRNERMAIADDVLYNHSGLDELQHATNQLVRWYNRLILQ